MRKWESAKLSGSKTKNVLAAQLMRDSATSTANRLDAMTLKIVEASKKYKTSSAQLAASRSPSPTQHQSDAESENAPTSTSLFSPTNTDVSKNGTRTVSRSGSFDARNSFKSALTSFHEANAKDDAILGQILSIVQQQIQPPAAPSIVASVPPFDPHPFSSSLRAAGEDYQPLVPYAARIVEKLGISALSDFVFVAEEDVSNVQLPALQQRMLVKLAKAYNVGTKL